MKKIAKILFIFLGLLVVVVCFLVWQTPAVEVKSFGVTFSKLMAEDFGVDWKESFNATVEDLKIKNIRIPVYWQEVEPMKGEFNFSWLDWMLETADKNNAKVILAIGRKVPRWPECHEPEWIINNQDTRYNNQRLLNYIKTTVERYDDNQVVWAWQVENEPFLKFGICPKADGNLLDEEIELVRSISDKPIIVTDGGEFGDWFRAYKRGDIFGSTLYRHVQTRFIGEWTYPLPPSFFRLRQSVVKMFYGEKPVFVAELQAEPWIDGVVKDADLETQYASFGPERFGELMEYIEGTGFDTFYFWGAEWWFFLKEQGHPEMWNLVKEKLNTF
ncbi:beta-galactosidase [Patescibacteria group bacterium]